MEFKNTPFIDDLVNNRRAARGGSGFIFGDPGSGKTVLTEQQVRSILSNSNDDVVILDTEGQYVSLAEKLDGQVIKFGGPDIRHINPLDLNVSFDPIVFSDDSPISNFHWCKKESIVALCSELIPSQLPFSPALTTIIESSVEQAYEPYLSSKARPTGTYNQALLPTLSDFLYTMRDKNKDPYPIDATAAILRPIFTNQTKAAATALNPFFSALATETAVALDYVFCGSKELDVLAKRTDFRHNSRLVVYDLSAMNGTLAAVPVLLSALEHVWTCYVSSPHENNYIWVFIDDVYQLLDSDQHSYAFDYLRSLYKRARSLGCILTGITNYPGDYLTKHSPLSVVVCNSGYIHVLSVSEKNAQHFEQFYNIPSVFTGFVSPFSPPGQALVFIDASSSNNIIAISGDHRYARRYAYIPSIGSCTVEEITY